MSRMLAKIQRYRDAQKQAQLLVDAALNSPGPRIVGRRTTGHDPARLRGIPAIGRNVSGAIPGTKPEQDAPSLRAVRGEV